MYKVLRLCGFTHDWPKNCLHAGPACVKRPGIWPPIGVRLGLSRFRRRWMVAGAGCAKGANATRQLRSWSLVPPGCIMERDGAQVQLTLRHRGASSLCLGCGTAARRSRSRCERLLVDLPTAGWTVRLGPQARRFRRDAVGCRRRIFTERFGPEMLAAWARRTSRLDEPCPRPSRSPTAGLRWRTPAAPSSVPRARRCGRSAAPWVRRASMSTCSRPESASNTSAVCAARRPTRSFSA